MSLVAVLPILIVFIVVILSISFFKKNLTPKAKFTSGNRVKFFMTVYVVVLLVAVIIYYVLPNGDNTDLVKGKEEFNKLSQVHHTIYEAASDGKIDQLKKAYKHEDWEFSYEGDQIIITPPDPDFDFILFVEKKNENDGKINVTSFKTSTVIEGIDFTEKFNDIDVNLVGDRLEAMYPGTREIKLARESKEFTITQFTNNENYGISMEEPGRIMGGNILYFQIPKDLKIMDEEKLMLQYVGEES